MLAVKSISHNNSIIFRRSLRLMGDQFEISVVGNNPSWADERIADAVAEINRVEKLLSAFSEDSAINTINRNAGIKPVKTNAEIFKLIDRALQISELTYGAFDITYLTADKDNNSDNQNGGIAVKTAVKVSYKNVEIDAAAQTVFLKEPGMRISFAANGKGYAADRAKYVLQLQGVSSGVINSGGDLLTWGAQPDNEPWTVATADPSQENVPFANVDISNMAVATSVNTDKYATVIDKKLLGSFNPKKGFPVSKIKSVSIISTTAEFADAMATPVLSIGINAGLYLINQLNQMAAVIIDDHDRVYTSKNVSIN
ncbi:FAD:protein FMN transferase [Mucilaginibacter sp. BJC16-A38]|uniref:FAD:protein FMN transferase n=1 Tax=Mucilaginibacter phenanthrenivorans TaxID=1234842 RepID=UPI0021575F5F|nr:FAD:protein FMN transferase [Mucilaginibacter phenanthrenivorans]MCR8557522.1 FAD:protein FMN transferase [Mucilaginibacter phenanthrenivorans]